MLSTSAFLKILTASFSKLSRSIVCGVFEKPIVASDWSRMPRPPVCSLRRKSPSVNTPATAPFASTSVTRPSRDSVILTIADDNVSPVSQTGFALRMTSLTRCVISAVCSRNCAVPSAVSVFSQRFFMTENGIVQTCTPVSIAWRTCSAWRTDENMTLLS